MNAALNSKTWRNAALDRQRSLAITAPFQELDAFKSNVGGQKHDIRMYCSGQLLYFGDLDPKGIWIPARAAQASGIEVFPEEVLYEVLLSKGLKHQMLPRLQFSFDPTLLDWLPLSLRAETCRQFKAGRRLPQELVSFHDIL